MLELGQILRRRNVRHDWRLPPLICLTGGLIVVWDVGVATNTLAYFTPIIHSLLPSFAHHRGRISAALPTGPVFDLTLEYLSILLLYLLVAIGVWRILPARRLPTWNLAFRIRAGRDRSGRGACASHCRIRRQRALWAILHLLHDPGRSRCGVRDL